MKDISQCWPDQLESQLAYQLPYFQFKTLVVTSGYWLWVPLRTGLIHELSMWTVDLIVMSVSHTRRSWLLGGWASILRKSVFCVGLTGIYPLCKLKCGKHGCCITVWFVPSESQTEVWAPFLSIMGCKALERWFLEGLFIPEGGQSHLHRLDVSRGKLSLLDSWHLLL